MINSINNNSAIPARISPLQNDATSCFKKIQTVISNVLDQIGALFRIVFSCCFNKKPAAAPANAAPANNAPQQNNGWPIPNLPPLQAWNPAAQTQIWASPGVAEVVPRVNYMPVLFQNYGQTGFDSETCGYHSIKNALFSFYNRGVDRNLIMRVFQDLGLFQVFFNRYCRPIADPKPANNKDIANIGDVLAIWQNFKNDQNPPAALIEIHRALNAPGAPSIGAFQFSSQVNADNTANPPVLANLDLAGFGERLKFARFIQAPGPAFFPMVASHEYHPRGELGHWTSLIVEKDAQGVLHWTGCDSANAITVGRNAIFALLARCLELEIPRINDFVKDSYTRCIGAALAERADWIDNDGNITPERADSLIQSREIGPMLRKSDEFFQEFHWNDNQDVVIQTHIANCQKLRNFLVARGFDLNQ